MGLDRYAQQTRAPLTDRISLKSLILVTKPQLNFQTFVPHPQCSDNLFSNSIKICSYSP